MLTLVHLGLSNVGRRWTRSFRTGAASQGSHSGLMLQTGFAPRQLFQDTVARHSFKVAVLASWAGYLEQNRFGRQVDLSRLIHMALFHDVVESHTGTFNHQFKQLLQPQIRRVEQLIGNDLLSRLPEPMQPSFRSWMLSLDDGSVESRLLSDLDDLEAALKCRREMVYGNHLFFADQYAQLRQELSRSDFQSVAAILQSIEQGGSFASLWDAVERLDMELRWEGKINFLTDDDASHSWRTSVIAAFLASLDRHFHGASVDEREVALRCIFHDLHEAFTGDVRTPVKHMDLEIHRAIADVEMQVNQILLSFLPEDIREPFTAALCTPKDGAPGQYVAMADALDALLKSAVEVACGNEAAYRRTFEEGLERIQQKFQQPVMRDVLAYVLPEFLRTDPRGQAS